MMMVRKQRRRKKKKREKRADSLHHIRRHLCHGSRHQDYVLETAETKDEIERQRQEISFFSFSILTRFWFDL